VSLESQDEKRTGPEVDLRLDDVIRLSSQPHTKATLVADLRSLGLKSGDTAIVHSALSRIGYVVGGAVTVIEALNEVIGSVGTLVMAAQSSDLTDPATWRQPAVPPHWIDIVRDAMPPYDPARTPAYRLGAVAELFRTWPGVGRSAHPVCSFTASGRLTPFILEPHGLDDPFGEASPLARLYQIDARILLLGAPWTTATALHLAERRAAPSDRPEYCLSPILVDGARRMASWAEYPHDSAAFAEIGPIIERCGLVRLGHVGDAPSRLLAMRDAVDIAVQELKRRVGS
jgi:aminoglycoside 3-N-acetyltransferase